MDWGGRRLDGDVQDYISLNVTCKSIQTASPHSLFCSLDLSLGSHLPSVRTFYLFFSRFFLARLAFVFLCFLLPYWFCFFPLFFPSLIFSLPVPSLTSSFCLPILTFSLICLCHPLLLLSSVSYFCCTFSSFNCFFVFVFHCFFSLPLISLYCIFFLSRRLK